MPSYRFSCKKCDLVYIDLVPYDATGKYSKVKCPNKKSKRKIQLPTACLEVIFTNPRGTSKADSFSYVADHNMEQAKGERRRAEAASHMGTQPFNDINDFNNDANFDFGKI